MGRGKASVLGKASSKPYARPEGKASTTTVAKPGIQRSDSQTSLFGGLKSIDAARPIRIIGAFRPLRQRPFRITAREETLEDALQSTIPEGIHSVMGPRGMTAMSKGSAVSPRPSTHSHPANASVVLLRRRDPCAGAGRLLRRSRSRSVPDRLIPWLRARLARDGPAYPRLMLLFIPPAPAQGSNAAWSPWTEQAEAHERKARTTTTTTTGFARSGSIGYGLHAVAASPLRPQTSSLFAPHASPARTWRRSQRRCLSPRIRITHCACAVMGARTEREGR
jgi:hypothetical protein